MTGSTDSTTTDCDCGPECGCGEITISQEPADETSGCCSEDLSTSDENQAHESGEIGCGPVCGCSSASGETTRSARATQQGPFGLRSVWTTSRALKTWTSGILLAAGLFLGIGVTSWNPTLLTSFGYAYSPSDILLLAGIVVGAEPFLTTGMSAIRRGTLTLAVLEGFAIVVATVLGLFVEAAVLAFLINLAEVLEAYSMDRVHDSLAELVELTPDAAFVRRDDEEVTIPVNEVAVGDLVVVRPGEKIPLDGEVVTGTSSVNEAPVTGESVPADKDEGDDVYAGSINEGSYLEIEATTEAENTTIAQVARLVEEAQTNQSEFERYADRLATYYTPIVAGGAALVAFVPPLLGLGGWQTWFVRGLTLVVIACPCAFIISTPVSVISGLTRGAKDGILIKGGEYLEALSQVDVVAFDKTGTLTTGDLSVTDVVTAPDQTETDLLTVAAAIEARSEHPIGETVRTYATETGITDTPSVTNFEVLTGSGVSAEVDETRYYVGKPDLFADFGFGNDGAGPTVAPDGGVLANPSVTATETWWLDEEMISSLERAGKTVVLVGSEDRLFGAIALADQPRPTAQPVIEWLQERGIRTVMLTGDNERTAQAVATELGIGEYHADLLPDDKLDVLEGFGDEAKTVAMVGDGINDTPALTTATVGIAMGAAGTDTALETADVALMNDDLGKLPAAYLLSHRTTRIIKQNVWGSLGIQGALAVAAPFGLVGPIIAVILGDAGLTVGVTVNALRLATVETHESTVKSQTPSE